MVGPYGSGREGEKGGYQTLASKPLIAWPTLPTSHFENTARPAVLGEISANRREQAQDKERDDYKRGEQSDSEIPHLTQNR